MSTTTKALNLRRRLHLDVALEFGRHCKAELDDDALQKLGDAVDTAVYNELNRASIEWNAETRRFVLGRVAEAARECQKKAGTGPVTPAIMAEVVKALVPAWEAQCKLPENAPPPDKERMGPVCPAALAVFAVL